MKTMKKWFLILAVLAFCVSLAAITAHAAENTEYYVAGTAGLCGSEWEACDSANRMSHEGNGFYRKVFENVPVGTHEFRVTDGTWDNSWGDGTGSDGNCRILVEEAPSTVVVWFYADEASVSVHVTPMRYYVSGPSSLCDSNWYPKDYKNKMTWGEDDIYTKVYTNVSADSYEIKVTDGTWDNCWGAAGSDENYAFTVDTNGSTVTVSFDPANEIVNVEVTFPEGGCAHVYDVVVTPHGCYEEGYTTHTCRLCGYEFVDNYTLFGCDYEVQHNVEGCGVVYDLYTCIRCGDTYTDPYNIPNHEFSKVVTLPTPEVNGYTTYTCNKCGYTYTDDETVYEIIGTGVCGDDVTWTLGNNGVVTISGTGDMYDFEISNSPWYRCANAIFMPITKAVISDGVTSIGNYAFNYLSQLKEINLPEGITRIGNGAFCDCGVANLELPDSLREIGKGAFEGAKLTSVTIPKNVTSIGSQAFYYCRKLKTVTISDGVTVISEWMFNHCTNLESITIPAGVTVIGGSAFYDCLRLTDVHYGKGEKDWKKISIDTGNTCLTAATIHYKYVATPKISALENKVDGVRIAWDAVPGAVKYKLVVKTATSAWKTIGYTSGTSFTWPRATSGVTYTFGIRCVTADGKEYTSDFDSTGKTIKYVAMPTIATAESAKDGVKLTWNAVPGAEKYKLMVKTDSGWKTIWNTVKTSYTWTGAESGKTYTFAIRCTTADGKAYTSAFDSTGKTIKYIAQPTIKKIANAANGVAIAWDKVPGAAKYKIVVKTATSGWKTIGYTTGTSFTWPRATSGVTYTFGIRCTTADGKEYTSAFDSTGKTIKFVACPAIASLENTKDGIKITWNKVAGAEKYKLVVKTDSGWKTIWNTVNNSYVWTDAVGGETYTFSIRCMTADGKNYTSAFNSTGWTHTYTQKIDG